MQTREALEVCKYDFINDSGRSLEEKNEDKDECSKDSTHKVSDGNKDSIGICLIT